MSNVTIQNDLSIDVKIYDSYSNGEKNYFGKLTLLGEIKANTKGEVTPTHTPMCVLIAFDEKGNPISRYVSMFDDNDFVIKQSDLTSMGEANKFVDFIVKNKDSDVGKSFYKVMDKSSPSATDDFFKKSADYKDCTFVSYMLALTHKAQTPASKAQPVEDKSYSLSMLVNYLSGASYPSGFPDISVKDFSCDEKNSILKFGATIDLSNLPYENAGEGKNILSLFPVKEVKVELMFDFQVGLNILGTRIMFISNDFVIPIGDKKTIKIDKPTVSIDINPLFKFVVFKVSAIIPFDIFSKKFDAKISMVIDNVEAEIGAVIDGEHNALPSPPILKGVHFDEFGLGMGIIFEPEGFALGLQGKFHIGEGKTIVSLDDDTFVLVCEMVEDVPNPLYVSFYIPKLDLPTLIDVFTDAKVDIDFPVMFDDLSFTWSENPMEPVVLPDGSLSNMAFGFSGYMNIFGLKFYSDLELTMNGAEGKAVLSPLKFGDIFSLTGDGKAITVKVDKDGNPIKNNQIAKTKQEKEAIASATIKEIVPSGGAEVSVSTLSSPFFTLASKISFLGLVNEKIDAVIDTNGISFELDYGSVIKSNMKCVLKDFHNFSSSYTDGLDVKVPLPSVGGFSLGTIHIVDTCTLNLALSTSSSDIDFSVSGGFDFEGLKLSFGPASLDVDISKVSDIISVGEKYILSHVSDIFSAIIKDAGVWAKFAEKEVIKGVEDVAKGLKEAYGKTVGEAAAVMKSAGYDINVAAEGLKSAYGASASAVASALKGVGYGASEVASALKSVGYAAEDVARALSGVYGLLPDAINTMLQGIGYTTDAIKDAFNSIGGAFADFASKTWDKVKHIVDPSNW